MTRLFRALTMLLALALLRGALNAQQRPQEMDLSGTYRCDGVSPSGKAYRSFVEIQRDRQTYIIRWMSRESPAVGIGIFRDGVLAVSYFTRTNDMGVVIYRIDKGRLVGEWTLLGADGRLFPETLTKVGLEAGHHAPDERAPADQASTVLEPIAVQ